MSRHGADTDTTVVRNVLYLVLDCLRMDAVTPETAPTLSALAKENPSAETCVAPAYWSLPSHATLFTGKYPHEHGVYHRQHEMESLPLVDAFNERGHRTVGVTSNIYFSRGQAFDRGFGEFYETRRPLNPRGLNPFSAVRRREPPEGPDLGTYLRVLGDAVRHERPVASLGNYLQAVSIELDRRYNYRKRLPGVDTERYGFLTGGSDRSESLLTDLFKRHAGADRPFFAFANFMDTHYPYQPPAEYLREETDGRYGVEDLQEMDPNLGNSWAFLDQHFGEGVNEADLELVRAAYRAEVRCVDDRVERLLDALERHGLREETLVVVTSDHGEVLGETDVRGERSMGHLRSLSEHLHTVPLILANPSLAPETVERAVPLGAVTDRLVEDGLDWLDGGVADALDDTTPALFELPANPFSEDSYEDQENVPDWYVERETDTHAVLAVEDDWLVVADSTGSLNAWENGEERDPEETPDDLAATSRKAVAAFPGVEVNGDRELSGDLQQQLEDLGYM
jgi:arylsulfatase A-like enzyme